MARLRFGGKADVYLEWAYATDFKYFLGGGKSDIGLLIEWKSGRLKRVGEVAKAFGIHAARVYTRGGEKGGPRRTWAVTIRVDQLKKFFRAAEPLIDRLELSVPLVPVESVVEMKELGRCNEDVLVGVLDDGCPFANDRFMTSAGTRVQWLWNQDADAQGVPLNGEIGPSVNTDFQYGAQFSKKALDAIIAMHGPEQDMIYADTGLKKLPETGIESIRRAASHGAHVMDLVAAEEKWPAVFVQFARKDIEDPTGLWLQNAVVDGLHYILQTAGKRTKTVVANVSWGPQTGPHDGSTVLEKEIDRLVRDEQKNNKRKLIVSLAGGNSFGSRAHARVREREGGALTWVVPPEAETPTFVEIWWPKRVAASDVSLTVTPPYGTAAVAKNGIIQNLGTWFVELYGDPNQQYTRALVTILPTGAADPAARGMHGRWTLTIAPRPSAAPRSKAHVYLPRADPNMGARRRARSSYLTDAALEAGRFVTPVDRFSNPPRTLVDRRGTLSGIATGKRSKVAAGYIFRTLEPAHYSSSGRSRGSRWKPDYSCITDHSQAIPGVRATGNRSGTKVRLVGTSTAAPQMGRQLATQLESPFNMLPYDPERSGEACLWPKPELIPRE